MQQFPKRGPGTSGVPKTITGSPLSKDYFHNNPKTLFSHSLSQKHTVTFFSRCCEGKYCKPLHAEEDGLGPSTKPDTKRICKNVQCSSSHCAFFWGGEVMAVVYKNMSYMLTCDRFIIFNEYIYTFSVLISSTVNTGRYNPKSKG